MNFLCWFKHNYQTVKKFKTKVVLGSAFSNDWEEEGIVYIEECKRCKKTKAWFISINNNKHEINPDYIKDIKI